ncbi:hypothetical protein F4560_000915 [Saccharothrix ecbatanensis]|uniref:Uncharacterized protein n=1 Tax=Saccharothrix ecbatanensis TaxID=1105145 RepID=A0A7W9LYY6_9PSEU|nr:hypothetical protein [Saccharothrix ecbatanensis]MBB5801147.1 hypothetical protein [Saccharothrix ecbatanensis]
MSHGWLNSSDVGLHKTAGGPAASVTDLGPVRSTRSAGHLDGGAAQRGRAA